MRGLAVALILVAMFLTLAASAPLDYPKTVKGKVVDDYHGREIADPYRWLEESGSDEVSRWEAAQNQVTRGYLDNLPGRDTIRRRFEELLDYERLGVPKKRGSKTFFTRNEGLQNQSVWYVQDGDGEPRVLIDPNTLREDGTGDVRFPSPSPNGRYFAYAVSWSGSDWVELHIRDVATGKDLKEVFKHVKFITPSWLPDESGFFYSRMPEPGTVPEGDEHYDMKVYFHKIGDDPADDAPIFQHPELREAGVYPRVTEDGRWLLVGSWGGGPGRSEYRAARLDNPVDVDLQPLMVGFDAGYSLIGSRGDILYFRTNNSASRYRVIAVDMNSPERENWVTVIDEAPDVLENASLLGEHFVTVYKHNATDRMRICNLGGEFLREVPLPKVGVISGLDGAETGTEITFGFTSFFVPLTGYSYDVASDDLRVLFQPKTNFDASQFTARQVWYESKDGTKVPMFLLHRRGVVLDGNNPVLLYGYGGFNVSLEPSFSASRVFWIEQGGVYAQPSLRGGGEFGEEWHEAGRLERKQNVFDDFICAAEYLIDHDYTSSDLIAIQGGSNGGLLTAACMAQRPDLFEAVLTQVPVVDMLRYHRFTVARYWIPEYGSAENPDQIGFLLDYSPLHNLKDGEEYPSTLITTADHDDRVHPGQAKKYAARLQEANASANPTLLRIDVRAGHGAGKPTAKRIDEAVDIYGFVMNELGMKPKQSDPN